MRSWSNIVRPIHQGGPSLAITNEKRDSQPQNSGHWVTILRFTNRNFKPSANTTGNLWKGAPSHIPSGKDEISTTQAAPRLTTKELGKGSTSIQTWQKNSTTGQKNSFLQRDDMCFFKVHGFWIFIHVKCWWIFVEVVVILLKSETNLNLYWSMFCCTCSRKVSDPKNSVETVDDTLARCNREHFLAPGIPHPETI